MVTEGGGATALTEEQDGDCQRAMALRTSRESARVRGDGLTNGARWLALESVRPVQHGQVGAVEPGWSGLVGPEFEF